MLAGTSRFVRTEFKALEPSEILTKPVGCLLGVTTPGGQALGQLGIANVFDLASSQTFATANRILDAANGVPIGLARYGRVPGELVDDVARTTELVDLPLKSLDVLRHIGPTLRQTLDSALDIGSIRDFALWPPYHAARAILSEAYGLESAPDADPEAPSDLIPANGQYPTERVQYEVLLFDQFAGGRTAARKRPVGKGVTGTGGLPTQQILGSDGPLDMSALLAGVEGFDCPAIGGVLTFTQSWYTKGLSLGHLIHGIALAPGESTKIAIIDWSRRVRTSATETIQEAEQLDSDLSRARSISEITSAVARETQRGQSAAHSASMATQIGTATGSANLRTPSINPFVPLMPGVETSGTSSGIATGLTDATSWSTSSGQREVGASLAQDIVDRTHQASHSVRNRRASIVREVSQQESESISTRTLTNYNHMHALTVEYYEVVQLYRTVVELSKADRCLFVPMKLIDFRNANLIDRYRAVLATVALSLPVREALEYPTGTTRIKAPAVSKADLYVQTGGTSSSTDRSPDSWSASDLHDATVATGGLIRVLPDGRLVLPSDAVLNDIDFVGAQIATDDADSALNRLAFFVGKTAITVSGSSAAETGKQIQKGSRIRLTAAGRVTYGSDGGVPASTPSAFFVGSLPVTVFANNVTNTGKRIQKGSRVTVTATGRVKFAQADPGSGYDANGLGQPPDPGFESSYPAGKLYRNSLICQVGVKWYQGGVSTEFVAGSDGDLVLRANDESLWDNQGQWEVGIEVAAPAAGNPDPGKNYDADGRANLASPDFYAVGRKEYSLICRIGTKWYQGGTNTEFVVDDDGALVLQANDLVGNLRNNSGTWDVALDVAAPATPPDTTKAGQLMIVKNDGTSVTLRHRQAGWGMQNNRLRIDEIASLAITTSGVVAGSIGFVVATFQFKSKDFRIGFPVKLESNSPSPIFYTIVPTDLISHLQDNRLYYSQVIWRALDPATIGLLLSGYTWSIGGNAKPLVELVDPNPVAIVANYLVLRISGDDEMEHTDWLDKKKIRVGSRREDQVPIPSGGVFAEAVLGRFNSAEKLDITRFWNWQDSPIPIQTPDIAPIQSGSRSEPDNTVPGRLGAPVLNIVNAPALPDPQGMGAILAAIQSGNMFRDMSGLAGTIGLAQAGLAGAEQGASNAAAQAGRNAEVAAEFGAKVAEVVGKLIASYFGGGAGGAAGGGAAGMAAGISGQGAKINQGNVMDSRGVPRTKGDEATISPVRPEATPGGTTRPTSPSVPQGGATTWASTAAGSWEGDAMNTALGRAEPFSTRGAPDIVLASTGRSGAGPIKLMEGEAADAKAASMMAAATPKRLQDGTQVVPGSIIAGRTMLVDTDDTFAYYVKDGALWEWGTQQFYRNEYIDKFGSEVIGAELLVQLTYIEISFIAGVFAAIPSSTAVISGFAAVVLANVLDIGLKVYHHRDVVSAGYRAGWKLKAARECLHQAVPEMMDRLESTVVWETVKNLPGTITGKEIAFWFGRVLRGVQLMAAPLALASIAAQVAKTTLALALIDAAVNIPAALMTTLDEQAHDLAAALKKEHVVVSEAEARQWLTVLQSNAQARRCLSSLQSAVEELIPAIQLLQPDLLR